MLFLHPTLMLQTVLILVLGAFLQAPVHIEGVVLDAATGRPLAGATVVIPPIYGSQIADNVGMPPVLRASIRARTDADGRFALDAPEAGPHELYAAKQGYEDWKITLSADEESRGVKVTFRLIGFAAPGVVSGRAIDAAGRPVVGTTVQLLGYSRMSQMFLGAFSDHPELHGSSEGQTNDRGEFRVIDVPPGEYFLRVSPPGTRTGELSPLGAVFYPGVSGLSKATKFEVHAGEEVRAGDLVLTPSPLGPIRVRTTNLVVGNPSGLAMPSLFGGPAPDNPPATTGFVDGVPAVRPDEPGDYRVCAGLMFLMETPRRMATGRNACAEVVYTGDPQEITLVIKNPEGYLTGRVMLEQTDGTPAVPLAGVGVAGATSGTDGFFKSLHPVQDGTITMRFTDAPDGFYITSIRQGSRDALAEGVVVAGADTNLDVRVAKGTGILRGRILDNEGRPADRAVVVLIPERSLALRSDKDDTHRTATTNLNGTYEIRDVIPGSYRAYAFAKLEAGAHLDSKFVKPFEEQGTLVEIPNSGTVLKELRQILK